MNTTQDQLTTFGLSSSFLQWLIERHETRTVPHLGRMWDYYRNDMLPADAAEASAGRRYRLAQERGLPARLTKTPSHGSSSLSGAAAKERVIENDIAWRMHTLVDFMFGKPDCYGCGSACTRENVNSN